MWRIGVTGDINEGQPSHIEPILRFTERPLACGGILDARKPVLTPRTMPRAHEMPSLLPHACKYTKEVEEADREYASQQ